MKPDPLTPDLLSRSVIAVPPLARSAEGRIAPLENQRLIRYLEDGGVTTLLYGGNAVLYHISLSDYATLLQLLAEHAADRTTVIPSLGPMYGTMMDQAAVFREFEFPSVMMLPAAEVKTSDGLAMAARKLAETIERPVMLYIKHDAYIDVASVAALMRDGVLSAIKYAVVREDPSRDEYLRALVDAVGAGRIVSGIGEQPAIVHMCQYQLQGFTSGCVCVAPKRSMEMLDAIHAGDIPRAESIRERFRELEDLRNSIHPIRVLHAAVQSGGLAQTGPITPLLTEVSEGELRAISTATASLLAWEQASSRPTTVR